ncbi:hypothetical protein LEP1GSC058_1606 [Leptospira fainei serovar Hurstbridge str. BUT 6]|uniref:Uncharacterized protein n=1 Tax=Leptospira fainei serovar Hurstbridge str. BUT 6 TaxID=1193011 RepID=S3UWV6_9LEPT|nr:hypothetical protein [Leptospira fainei]EPG74876.1 hypothetical protein LEP1GSC058_1606 [Leptospira fainei serovar Hurstbridge str. BUT 6]
MRSGAIVLILVLSIPFLDCRQGHYTNDKVDDSLNQFMFVALYLLLTQPSPCSTFNIVQLTTSYQKLPFSQDNIRHPSPYWGDSFVGYAAGTILAGQSYKVQSTTTNLNSSFGSASVYYPPAICSSENTANIASRALASCSSSSNNISCSVNGGFTNNYLFVLELYFPYSLSLVYPTDISIKIQ